MLPRALIGGLLARLNPGVSSDIIGAKNCNSGNDWESAQDSNDVLAAIEFFFI